ncbi:hypothetical protein DPPLL_28190 [Desulfofustis limnaeus]|uniref:Uncharacterized protein n=1 Tax=Desulfofustis limnaeus TaxID=2740163 RepID=A0ABM7WBX9_9BACT|nr:hypothetical protein DPPLL_28190 [Desulfofustis limnaeus]
MNGRLGWNRRGKVKERGGEFCKRWPRKIDTDQGRQFTAHEFIQAVKTTAVSSAWMAEEPGVITFLWNVYGKRSNTNESTFMRMIQ